MNMRANSLLMNYPCEVWFEIKLVKKYKTLTSHISVQKEE